MIFKWICCADNEETLKKPDPSTPDPPASSFARRLSTYLQKNSETLNRIVVPANHSSSNPQTSLQISIVECPENQNVKPCKIFPNALENFDNPSGIVYFGLDSQKSFYITNQPEIPEKSLCIFFDFFEQKFFIKDLCLNTFIKIIEKKLTEGNYLLSFIDKRLLIALNQKMLVIKIADSGEEHKFGIDDSPVTVGRSENCKVKIVGKNISRVQCTFVYDNCWVLFDGHEGGVSRNGTWFMPMEKSEVFNGMIFNANKIIFSVAIEEGVPSA